MQGTRTLETSKGRTVETPYTDEQAVEIAAGIDDGFARSLVSQYRESFRGLSSDQMTWIHILAVRQSQARIALAPIVGLLGRAAERLKRPKIVLRIASGAEIRIGIAGDKSRDPGSLTVVKVRGSTWLGRVTTAGEWQPSGFADQSTAREVYDVLQRLADDPAATAAEYGKMTGFCCFCSRPLADERSTSVGYGPVCAAKFNLPWGARGTTTTTNQENEHVQG